MTPLPPPHPDRRCDWYFADQTQCPNMATHIEPEFGMDAYCDANHNPEATMPEIPNRQQRTDDVPESLRDSDPDMYRLLKADLIPAVEVTFMIDGLTLTHQDLHQVAGAIEAWIPRDQAAVIRLKDLVWDKGGRDAWLVPVPADIVIQTIERGIYDEHIEWHATPTRTVPVDIQMEWDPRGMSVAEITEFYK